MASTPRSSGPSVVFANISLVSSTHSNCHHHHSWSAQDGRSTSNKINPVILCFMPIFLSLLQLKYGGGGASPYRTHPMTMGFGVTCLLMSCLAYLLKNEYLLKSPLPSVCRRALEHATLLLGSLSLVSLGTLLLPSSWTTDTCVVYIFVSMGVGALLCFMLFQCKLSTLSEAGMARGNLLLSSALSVDQETDPPV